MTERNGAFIGRPIKIDRRLLELIEQENHGSEQKNEELHRHFDYGVKQKPEATRHQRAAGKIPLHLRLVGSEVGECEKETTKNSRPKGVAPVGIKREIDSLKFSHPAGDR